MLGDYTDSVATKIQEIADSIPTRVQEHIALIGTGMAAPLQLTYGGGIESQAAAEQAVNVDDIAQKARENFISRTNRLEQIAQKKQNLVEKLLDTMQVWPLSGEEVQTEVKRIILMGKPPEGSEEMVAMCAIDIDASTNGITDVDLSVEGKTLDQLKEDGFDTTTLAVETHPSVTDYLVYATHQYNKHFDNQPDIRKA